MALFNDIENKSDISANYYKVRNMAWELLLKNKVTEYPLDLQAIIRQNNWTYLSYKEFSEKRNMSIKEIKDRFSPSGFSFMVKNEYFIVINEELHIHMQRFTTAHEIGHIVLHKVIPNKKQLEKEANMFAARILMPIFLIKELNITTKEELSKLCNVSPESAEFRLIRYDEIKGREKFYTNPLEKQVYENLKPFINRVRKD